MTRELMPQSALQNSSLMEWPACPAPSDLLQLFLAAPLNPTPLTVRTFDAPPAANLLALYRVYGASDCDGRSLP